jgi:hypothetical protein
VGGGGGFGGSGSSGDSVAIYRQLMADNNRDAKWLLLNSDGNPRPTEKGAYLGVGVTPVPAVVRDQLKLQRGVGLVANFIEKESPAESAGLHENDILTKLDDQMLVNPQQFAVLVRIHKVDEPMKLTLIREAKPMEISARLVERDLPVLSDAYGAARQTYELTRAASSQMPFAYSPFGASANFQMESSDDQHNFSVTRSNGHCTVLARDKDGKVIFDGPIDTDEQMEKVPKAVRPKVEKLRNWPARVPTSMPINTLRILPPVPTPTVVSPTASTASSIDPTVPRRQSTGAEPTY